MQLKDFERLEKINPYATRWFSDSLDKFFSWRCVNDGKSKYFFVN